MPSMLSLNRRLPHRHCCAGRKSSSCRSVWNPGQLRLHARHRGRAFAAGTEESAGLFAALKAVRMTIARQENVPAYVVFSNATLMDMADKAPCSMVEFLEVSGVGEVKAERYGQTFLDAIIAYQQEH